MNTQANAFTKTRRLVATAILRLLGAVLQLASSFIKIGSLNPAFVLLPIVIGTVLSECVWRCARFFSTYNIYQLRV